MAKAKASPRRSTATAVPPGAAPARPERRTPAEVARGSPGAFAHLRDEARILAGALPPSSENFGARSPRAKHRSRREGGGCGPSAASPAGTSKGV